MAAPRKALLPPSLKTVLGGASFLLPQAPVHGGTTATQSPAVLTLQRPVHKNWCQLVPSHHRDQFRGKRAQCQPCHCRGQLTGELSPRQPCPHSHYQGQFTEEMAFSQPSHPRHGRGQSTGELVPGRLQQACLCQGQFAGRLRPICSQQPRRSHNQPQEGLVRQRSSKPHQIRNQS